MTRVLIAVELDDDQLPAIGEEFYVNNSRYEGTHLGGLTGYVASIGEDPLGEPPEDLRDAWARFQRGEHIEPYQLRRLDEWRVDRARDEGF